MRQVLTLAALGIVWFWLVLLVAWQVAAAPTVAARPQPMFCAEYWSYQPERQPEQECWQSRRSREGHSLMPPTPGPRPRAGS